MKKLYYIITTLLFVSSIFLATGCDEYDEVPPRNESSLKQYVLPKAQPLTDSDRKEINERQKEYDESLKN